MIWPNFNAVPLGESSLKRWCRSRISTSASRSFSALAAISASLIVRLTARLMLGDHSSGISWAAARSLLHLRFVEAGGGHHQRNLLLPADFEERFGGRRHGEIDHHVDGRLKRGRERHADAADAGHEPGVFAQARMLRRVDGGDKRQFGIGGHAAQPAAVPCVRRPRE